MIGYIRIIATPCFLGCPCEKIFIQSNKLFSRAALFAQVIHSDYRVVILDANIQFSVVTVSKTYYSVILK